MNYFKRIAFALTELRKYLIPDSNDEIRQEQMREMEIITSNGELLENLKQECLKKYIFIYIFKIFAKIFITVNTRMRRGQQEVPSVTSKIYD